MVKLKLILISSLVSLLLLDVTGQLNSPNSFFDLDNPFVDYATTNSAPICKEIDGVSHGQGSLNKRFDGIPQKACWTITLYQVEFISIHITNLLLPFENIYPSKKDCLKAGNYLSLDPTSDVLSEQYIEDGFWNRQQSDFHSDDSAFLCGTSPQRTLYTFRTKKLRIVFASQNYRSSGFSLNYEVAQTCHSNVEIYSYDFILSPGFPKYPPGDTFCTWKITLHPSSPRLPIQFSLTFWKVGIYNTSSLTLYDGSSREDRVLAVYFYYTPSTVYSSMVSSTGQSMLVEFKYGYPPDIYRELAHGFNATVKVQGYCLPGTRPCGDGKNCFRNDKRCNRVRDCPNGHDELGCHEYNCSESEYWCGSVTKACYSYKQRCDGNIDCHKTEADERDCEVCAEGAFFCKASRTCVFEKYKCDGEPDCHGNEDEENCSYATSRRVITAAIVGSLVCGWLLAIALGCSCKLYSLRTASSRSHRGRFGLSAPLGHVARALLRREAPPSYNMAVDGVEASESSRSRSSSSNRRRRERRRRRRNRDPQIRRAQPGPREATPSILNPGNNRDDISEAANSSRQNSSSTTSQSTTRSGSSAASSSPPQSTSNDGDVPFILAEMGLAEFPSRTSTELSATESMSSAPPGPETVPSPCSGNTVASRPSGSSDPADDEPQAQPLPIKKRIRPVMIEAPFNAVLADEIPACVYPNPPSYSEAVLTGEPQAAPVTSSPLQEVEPPPAKSPRRAKELLNKLWPKSSPSSRNFWKFSSITDVFTTNSPSSSFRRPDSSVPLDEDQVRLINEFGSEDSQFLAEEDSSSMDVVEEQIVPSSNTSYFNLVPVNRSADSMSSNLTQSSLQESPSPPTSTNPNPTQDTSQFPSDPKVTVEDLNDPFELRISGQTSIDNAHPSSGSTTTSIDSSLATRTAWSSPVRVSIPEIRVETPDRLLTLNISGSLSERT